MPALPLGDAGPYVAAAYLVFLALILIYVGIMASKLVRIERQAAELNELAARQAATGDAHGLQANGTESSATTGSSPANGAESLPAAGRAEGP